MMKMFGIDAVITLVFYAVSRYFVRMENEFYQMAIFGCGVVLGSIFMKVIQ